MKVVYRSPVLTLETHGVVGRDGTTAEFVRMRMPDWATVVALTADDRVVVVRQPRMGSGGVHLETPGGIVEPGESGLAAGKRELLEETGYTSEDWSELGVVYPNPALQDNRCHLLLARGAVVSGPPRPDPFERITVQTVPLTEVRALLLAGELDHALSVVALQRVLLGV